MAEESALSERVGRVLELSSRALALASGEESGQWEALAEVVAERQSAIESVFALPLVESDFPKVREMAESIRETDAEIFLLVKQKKQSIAQQSVALALGQLARSAYLASENDNL
ncbi:flagellar protein FliT [Methylogaea oryzae]|uniref:flagellar protein FliT n=1 Tax=Methylogaea oryzae TaxID=1295382 RepID=UPI00138F2117|nr:flagellar protein FliT [Methylogaea oryzae]